MKVGDKVQFRPAVFESETAVSVERQRPKAPIITGTVSYIHPERRFYVVEYKVHGHTLHQTLYFKR